MFQDDIDVMFIYVDSTQKHLENVISYFHVDAKKEIPCYRMTKMDEYHSRFVPDSKEFTTEAFNKFTRNVMQGKVLVKIIYILIMLVWKKLFHL